MAILINQTNANSGETLLASSSLENSISEAKNLSIELDQKMASFKNESEKIKKYNDQNLTDVFDRMKEKETSFTNSINTSATNAVIKISKSINELKQGADLVKNIWLIPQAIAIHFVLFIVELALIFWFALPIIKKAKEVLNDNEETIKISFECKQENERLREENQALEAVKNDLYSFIVYSYGSSEKAKQVYSKWKEQ